MRSLMSGRYSQVLAHLGEQKRVAEEGVHHAQFLLAYGMLGWSFWLVLFLLRVFELEDLPKSSFLLALLGFGLLEIVRH